MARMRVFIVLVLALTAGGALAFATYNYVQSQGSRPAPSAMPTRRWSWRRPTSRSAPS